MQQPLYFCPQSRAVQRCCFLHAHTSAPFTNEHPALLPISFLRRKQRSSNWERLSLVSRALLLTANGSLVSWQAFPLFSLEVFFSACWLARKESLPKWSIMDPQGVLSCAVGLLMWALLLFLPCVQFSWSEIHSKQFQLYLCGFFCLNSILLWVPRAQLMTHDFIQTHFAVWRLSLSHKKSAESLQGACKEPCKGTNPGGYWMKWHVRYSWIIYFNEFHFV